MVTPQQSFTAHYIEYEYDQRGPIINPTCLQATKRPYGGLCLVLNNKRALHEVTSNSLCTFTMSFEEDLHSHETPSVWPITNYWGNSSGSIIC